jgi:hypothetical protein
MRVAQKAKTESRRRAELRKTAKNSDKNDDSTQISGSSMAGQSTAENNQPTITMDDFAETLGSHGIFSIVRAACMVWQHGSYEDLQRMSFPKSVEAFGAQLCLEKAEKLEALEFLIAERSPVS